MRMLLIRHATRDGDSLSETGVEEAKALAARLDRLGVALDAVYTSGSDDSKETASHLKSRQRPLSRAEAISLTGEDLWQFRCGRATVEFRTGLAGEPEEQLREKLHSKTAIATLLAGFTFAALIELVTHDPIPDLEAVAIGLLTLSLGLLLACIYVYDQLSLPPGFWSATDRSAGDATSRRARVLRPVEGFGHSLRARTWQWLFTPAVVSGAVAFVLLLLATDDILLFAVCVVVLVVVVGLYVSLRPRLGPD